MKIKIVHVSQINQHTLVTFIHDGDSLFPLPSNDPVPVVKEGGAALAVKINQDFTDFELFSLQGSIESYFWGSIKQDELKEEAENELWIFISSYYTEKKTKEKAGKTVIIPPGINLTDRERLYVLSIVLAKTFLRLKEDGSDLYMDQVFMIMYQSIIHRTK